jgi:hypothetical protein
MCVTAVITAQGEFTMTTSDLETATLQVAPADPAAERKATTKAHTARRKPRVAPAKGKSGKKRRPRPRRRPRARRPPKKLVSRPLRLPSW